MKKMPLILNLKLVNSYFPFQSEEIKIPENFNAKLSGEGTGYSVTLSWQYDKNTPPVKFNIYMKNGSKDEPGGFFKAFTIYGKKYVANYITSGRKYSYYITAVTPKGESEPSEIIEVTIADPVVEELKFSGVYAKKNWQALGETKSSAFKAATNDDGGFGNFNVVAGSKGFFRVKSNSGNNGLHSLKKDYGEKTISEN